MYRFALFVDGSNLFGALKAMNLEVHDYERFYSYLYREAQVGWHKVTGQETKTAVQLRRIYWYVVGSIDEWDLSLPQSQSALRSAFERDRSIHDYWMQSTGRANPELGGATLEEKSWIACFSDFRSWYDHSAASTWVPAIWHLQCP
jgi:hypothetical protein